MESIAFTPALAPGVVDAARAVHTWMSDTVKVVGRFREPFWREAGLAGAALSHAGPFCEFHDHSGPDADQAALFGFGPAARLGGAAAEEIAERFAPGAHGRAARVRLDRDGSAFPGYLEGPVLAGRRAAGQALDRLAQGSSPAADLNRAHGGRPLHDPDR